MSKSLLFLGIFATLLSLFLPVIVFIHPGFSHWTIISLIVLAAICSLLFWLTFLTKFQTPVEPISILKSEIELTLEDKTGKLASYRKQQMVVANVDYVVSYIEQGLKADPEGGRIEAFKAFTRMSQSDFVENKFEVKEPDKRYQILFDPLPVRGVRFERTVECKFVNSFVKPHEWFACYCTRPIMTITITIRFPQDRLPKGKPRLFVLDQYSYFRVETPGFTMSPDRRQLVWNKRRPIRGATYRIEWDW